jgi:riboflavin synthase alpha subunit
LTAFIQHTVNVTRMQQYKPQTPVNNTPDDVLKGGIPNTARARKAKYAKVTDNVNLSSDNR